MAFKGLNGLMVFKGQLYQNLFNGHWVNSIATVVNVLTCICSVFDDSGDFYDGNFAADADAVLADELTNEVDSARHPHHNFRTPAESFYHH